MAFFKCQQNFSRILTRFSELSRWPQLCWHFFLENYLLPSNQEHGFGYIFMSWFAQQIIPDEPDKILMSTSSQPARLLSLISVSLQFMGGAQVYPSMAEHILSSG
jgi:hypothetical protein